MRRLTLVLLFLFPAFASAQEQWTLDDCIAYALEHNIDIRQRELSAEGKRIDLAVSKWSYAPDISASNSYNLSSGRVLDPTTYNFVENQTVQGNNTSVAANITLFNGLRNLHSLKRAKLDLRASLLEVERMRNDVTLNITACYLEVLCTGENIRNAEQILASLKVQQEKTARKVEAGKVTTADLLQIRSQTADAENDLLSARNAYDIARLNICQLLELDDYALFQPAAPESDVPADSGGAWSTATASAGDVPDASGVLEAAQSLPQLEAARLGVDIARRDLQLARSAYYPTLSLGAAYGSSFSDARQKMFQNADGTYRYEAYPFFDQYRDNANKYISVSLNVPIFGRLTARKNVQRQKLAIRQAEYSLRTAEKQVAREVTQAIIDARTAWEKYLSSQQYVASATEAARQVERRYDLGVATVVDYNTAVSSLVRAQTQLLQAKYEFVFKTKVIEFYLKSE